jgi:uncharacterized damage-inducible protein DinB
MLSLEWVRALARYNRWMNDKLYGLAADMSDEARRRQSGAFFGSIHGTFNHILLADRIWLGRFRGDEVPDGHMGPGGILSLDQQLYADFAELRRERVKTDEVLSVWVSELTLDRLAAPLVFKRRGATLSSPLWWSVAHVFNHQTHHRGQISTLLTQQGIDPGVTDLVAMLRSEGASGSSSSSPSR